MKRLCAIALLAIAPTLAAADTPPPAGSLALSEIVTKVETDAGASLAYIESVDWDDDGYWEVEYRTTDGKEVKLRADPATGAPVAAN